MTKRKRKHLATLPFGFYARREPTSGEIPDNDNNRCCHGLSEADCAFTPLRQCSGLGPERLPQDPDVKPARLRRRDKRGISSKHALEIMQAAMTKAEYQYSSHQMSNAYAGVARQLANRSWWKRAMLKVSTKTREWSE